MPTFARPSLFSCLCPLLVGSLLSLAGAGCGDDETGAPPAPPPGRSVVVRGANGVADLDVIAHRADGSFAASAKTDANGVAQLAVPPGGAVTIAWARGSYFSPARRSLVTYLSVGDDVNAPLELAAPTPPPSRDPFAVTSDQTMHVTVDVTGAPADRAVSVRLACADEFYPLAPRLDPSPLRAIFSPYEGCPGASSYDVLAIADPAPSGDRRYGLVLDAPRGQTQFATHSVVLDQTAPAAATRNVTLSVGDVPAGPAAARRRVYGHRVRGDAKPFLLETYEASAVAAPAEPAQFPWSPAASTAIFAELSLDETVEFGPNFEDSGMPGNEGQGGPRGSYRRGAVHRGRLDLTRSSPAPLVWSASTLMSIDSAPVPDVNDPKAPVAAWKASDGGAAGDRMAVTVRWRGAKDSDVAWTVMLPPAREGTLRFPDAGPTAAAYLSGAVPFAYDVRVHDDAGAQGYEQALRALAGDGNSALDAFESFSARTWYVEGR